jgi:hypothetical protein
MHAISDRADVETPVLEQLPNVGMSEPLNMSGVAFLQV